ncbi:substrate-binding periplasmic protein [Nesterenkonia lutea]|uniref:ABC-type amino acid transport substrate-binding protein n=1 Tax=Nesterenkonia lutea TaxID=272919 RepID=A0ABR9JEM0_9MICC|nr:transporter substrate-binding domain-containing protein [Nesterenkonia lutea]MBE1524375.1 ABC-type amino acid transport substrate-binding protein [Nesterenkonia lutea]
MKRLTVLEQKPVTAFIATSSIALLVLTGCSGDAGTEPDSANAATGDVAEDCTPLHEFPTLEDGVLNVAAMNAAPKFHALSDSGPFEGIDATLITEFAEENCLDVLFKPMTGAAAQLDLREGKSDLFGGLHIKTAERGEVFGQAEGYVIYDALGITSASEDSFDTIESMDGATVGVLSGSFFAETLKDALGEENIEEYQSDTNAFEDLQAGRIDAVANQSMMSFNLSNDAEGYETNIIDEDPNHPELTALLEINWPHTHGVPEFTAAIDDYYTRAKEDGTVERVLEENGVTEEAADFYINGR